MNKNINESINDYPWCYALKIDPFITMDQIKEVKEINQWELLFIFVNGEKIIYDIDTGYHRNLFYKNINDLTEEQEKREFGYALRSMMRRRWITQEELAKNIGTTQAMISRYVSGKALPNILIGRKIAKVLGCSMDELFYINYNKYLEEN